MALKQGTDQKTIVDGGAPKFSHYAFPRKREPTGACWGLTLDCKLRENLQPCHCLRHTVLRRWNRTRSAGQVVSSAKASVFQAVNSVNSSEVMCSEVKCFGRSTCDIWVWIQPRMKTSFGSSRRSRTLLDSVTHSLYSCAAFVACPMHRSYAQHATGFRTK